MKNEFLWKDKIFSPKSLSSFKVFHFQISEWRKLWNILLIHVTKLKGQFSEVFMPVGYQQI